MAVPEKDELGGDIVQRHVDAHSSKLNAAYKRVQELLNAMSKQYLSLGEEERGKRRSLLVAVEHLIIVHHNSQPWDGADGEVHVSESMFGAWEKRLEAAKEAAAVAQLYWMADVIKEISNSLGAPRR